MRLPSIISDAHPESASRRLGSTLIAKLVEPNYTPESEAENQQLDTFALLIAGIWFNVHASYSQGQIDETSYRVYCDDVTARLSQWPALKPYFRKVLERYPSAKVQPIFAPVFE